MSNATYNGWTNYATWRVNLELFDGSEGLWDHHSAKEFAEYFIYSTTEEGVARAYALAFMSDVNWYEIASHYIEETEDEGLEEYFVDLIEEGQTDTIIFECQAEDKEHAIEQAENSYPKCKIVSVV